MAKLINPTKEKIIMVRFTDKQYEEIKRIADKYARGKVATTIRFIFENMSEELENILKKGAKE